MIIRKENKACEINNRYPNTDWYNQGNYIIDETTNEGKQLMEKALKNAPYFDVIADENNVVMDICIYPDINYSIDKTTITTTEIATITVSDPIPIQVIVDNIDYGIDEDGIIEYQDENVGEHTIELRVEGYKPAIIKIEVIE